VEHACAAAGPEAVARAFKLDVGEEEENAVVRSKRLGVRGEVGEPYLTQKGLSLAATARPPCAGREIRVPTEPRSPERPRRPLEHPASDQHRRQRRRSHTVGDRLEVRTSNRVAHLGVPVAIGNRRTGNNEHRKDGEHPHVAGRLRQRSASKTSLSASCATLAAVAARKPRPVIDERIDRELSRRLTPQQHRYFWAAEAPALGGMTPYEALLAGKREAVLELALGRPGDNATTALVSYAEGARLRAALGDRTRPPYEL